MKKLSKLKLNQLSQAQLDEHEMNVLKGGGTPGDCCCACKYVNYGGSSSADNDAANNAEGKRSPGYDCYDYVAPKNTSGLECVTHMQVNPYNINNCIF